MKKIFTLLASTLLLIGCVQSIALIGPASGVVSGDLAQSAIRSGLSYGIKKQTGKSPFEHALAHTKKADEKICKTIDKEKPKSCNVISRQLISAQAVIEKKNKVISRIKVDAKNNIKAKTKSAKELALNITTETKDSIETKKKSARELALAIQFAIKEKSKNKNF